MNTGSWFWPDVSNLEGAEDACRLAKWCALIVSGMTALLVLVSVTGLGLAGIRPPALLGAALFGFIAYGLEKRSRIAAVAGFVLYFGERVYMIVTTGSFLGAGALGIVFLIGFLNGMRGAFAVAKLTPAAAQPPEATA